MAEREGFEPSIRFPVYTRSRRAPSTTRPPLHMRRDRRSGKDDAAHLVDLAPDAKPSFTLPSCEAADATVPASPPAASADADRRVAGAFRFRVVRDPCARSRAFRLSVPPQAGGLDDGGPPPPRDSQARRRARCALVLAVPDPDRRSRSAVAEVRGALFHEGGHALALVIEREHGMEDAALVAQAFGQRGLVGAVHRLLGHHDGR